MGCISSKQAVSAASPAFERHHLHGPRRRNPNPNPPLLLPKRGGGGNKGTTRQTQQHDPAASQSNHYHYRLAGGEEEEDRRQQQQQGFDSDCDPDGRELSKRALRVAPRHVEAEHIAAGWPSWLSSAAGEAIHGWVPLRADAYEKLEKIGQGTYSSVFRAREVETGKIFALKKVNFDNFQRESVRFMAREIMILRKLDHPNIVKLEGIITSRLSCNIYLVFEYMEHDLSGLLSSPDVNLSEAQIKCYMKQLLAGVEHCHMRGVMHRDIKASNILVNNQGVLKLGDFGLANVLSSRNRQSLTSRVVTLWYRPPELLMGSTDYGVSVDLWSVGCVFAELLVGKPVLKGRTEVEQLHKIFKLCGSPPEDYWKQCKLPLATMFKPQQAYESSLQERFKDFPSTSVSLIETLLSIEPHRRGTASSALLSEYFTTKPLACEPSSLPKYPPNKEIDAKNRQAARRKKASRTRESAETKKSRKDCKALQYPNGITEAVHENPQMTRRLNGIDLKIPSGRGVGYIEETNASKVDSHFSGPVVIQAPPSFSWAARQNEDVISSMSYNMSSTCLISPVDSKEPNSKSSLGIPGKENDGMVSSKANTGFRCDTNEAGKHVTWKNHNQNDLQDIKERVEFSGPLLSQPDKIDEILQRNERRIRRGVRNPRF